jgi:hypothetical protein
LNKILNAKKLKEEKQQEESNPERTLENKLEVAVLSSPEKTERLFTETVVLIWDETFPDGSRIK